MKTEHQGDGVQADQLAAGPSASLNMNRSVKNLVMPIFRGGDARVARRWLDDLELYRRCHHWDEDFSLSNVKLFLEGPPRTWFENKSEALPTWPSFVAAFTFAYADGAKIKRSAKLQLKKRAQLAGESCHDYVQEIVRLCRDISPTFEEKERVKHILKGIAFNVYSFLLLKDVQTVDEILQHCRYLDEQMSERIESRGIERLTTAPLFPTYTKNISRETEDDEEDDRAAATQASQLLSAPVSAPSLVETITEVVEKILEKRFPTPMQSSPPRYFERNQPFRGPYRDNRQCYNCHYYGHISRFCPDRQRYRDQRYSRDGRGGYSYARAERSEPDNPSNREPQSQSYDGRRSYDEGAFPQYDPNYRRPSRARSWSPAPRGRSPGRNSSSRSAVVSTEDPSRSSLVTRESNLS